MNELLVELLAAENKRLRDEIIKLKARIYDLEHPEPQGSFYEKVFEPLINAANALNMKGGDENHGNDELVDGFGAERGDYAL